MRLLAGLLLLLGLCPKADSKEFKLYAALVDDTEVTLGDGASWLMDKGDVFPVLMFKDQQANVVLQLAETNFRTATRNIRVLEEAEIPGGLAKYEVNVRAYEVAKQARVKASLFARPVVTLR
jgi:hypothetical protein